MLLGLRLFLYGHAPQVKEGQLRIVVGRVLRYSLFFLSARFYRLGHRHDLGCFRLFCLLYIFRFFLFSGFLFFPDWILIFLNWLPCLFFLFLADKGRAVETRELSEVQMLGKFVLQAFTEIMCDALHTSCMQILQCWFAILVVSSHDAGGKHIFGMMLEIIISDDVLILGRVHPFQSLLILSQSLLGIVLLNDDQVTTCLRVGIFLEEIVRQTEGCDKVGLLKEVVDSDAVLLPVEIVSRRDECYNATVAHSVKSLLHEIAVDRFGNNSVEQALAVAIEGVIHLSVSKGNVGDGEVIGA